tara:strand:+ start:1857 stop:3269 length:1413 start_codon:yes stop_codon:yes gene_type:complete
MSEFTQYGTQPYDQLVEKWNPVLNHDSFDKIGDSYKKKVTAVLLENQEIAMKQQYLAEAPTNSMGGGFSVTQAANQAGSIAGYDPVLISLIRRSMPNLMAYDICGVQPMSAPTGLIFAMKSKYDSQGSSQEALFQEAFAKFSGKGGTTAGAAENAGSGVTFVGDNPGVTLTAGEFARAAVFGTDFQGISAANAEGLGGAGGSFNQMAFSIERVAVEARTRALKAEYSTELAQDLKAVHGLDAETELANILSTEILTEINREIIRNVYFNAEIGCTQTDLAGAGATDGPVSGMYDLAVDSDGRWSAERFRGLMFQIERECNQIAKETRRGKGNFIIVSSDVASALAMGGFLNISPALNQQLDVDDTGNTFAGLLNGKIRVYVDPYVATGQNHVCVGYKGTSPYDAGLFYCPYVPLQMVRAVGENTFQPKIGFKTRYGVVSNPFANSTDILTAGGNQYYRLFVVKNLHGNGS